MPDTETLVAEPGRGIQLPPPLVPVVAACANCGTPLGGPYCANCGQHVADFHRSVWRFVADFLDSTICWDNKLLLTLEPLFKQPGFLTHEFMAGRRVRYVHPLRLFLFTSAVCLALLKYGHGVHQSAARTDHAHQAAKDTQVQLATPALPPATPDPGPVSIKPAEAVPLDPPAKESADHKADAKTGTDADDDDDALGRSIRQTVADHLKAANKGKEAELEAATEKIEEASSKTEDATERMARAADRMAAPGSAEHLSWVALALLPLFALGLRAFYRRRERFYFEHLIFSLHYHVFLLLFWTAYVGVLTVASFLPMHGMFEGVVRLGLLLPPVYLYVALRRIYGEGTKRTVFKVLLLGSLHLLAIVIGVEAVGAADFL